MTYINQWLPFSSSVENMSPLRECSIFLTLPVEIRLYIICFCKGIEQKQLRLTSRLLNEETLPVLFRHIRVDVLEECLEKLRRIASSACVATTVKSLVVSSNLLCPCTLQDFEGKLRCHADMADLPMERQWVKASFLRYETQRVSQRAQLDGLGPVLRAFNRLQTVKVIWLYDVQVSPYWHAVGKEIFSPRAVCIGSWTTNQVQGCSVAGQLWPSRLPLGVTALNYQSVPLHCWSIQGRISVWSSLRHLRLRIARAKSGAEKESVRLGLQRLLAAAGLIQSLYLSADPSVNYRDRFDFGTALMKVDSLTSLQDLTIETGIMQEDDLIQLHDRYTCSLRKLKIRDIHLCNGHWQTIFTVFRSSGFSCKIEMEALTEGNGWYVNTILSFFETKYIR